ncbi:MAG: hypothetical protein HY526_12870 [Betaproteobacteria bacterium]|nr:hypothetical protein [Betaproteobacteria bacterium]
MRYLIAVGLVAALPVVAADWRSPPGGPTFDTGELARQHSLLDEQRRRLDHERQLESQRLEREHRFQIERLRHEQRLEVLLREREARLREQDWQRATDDEVERAHPGWKSLMSTAQFNAWYLDQPASLQRLRDSGRAEDVMVVLDLYKRDAANAARRAR